MILLYRCEDGKHVGEITRDFFAITQLSQVSRNLAAFSLDNEGKDGRYLYVHVSTTRNYQTFSSGLSSTPGYG